MFPEIDDEDCSLIKLFIYLFLTKTPKSKFSNFKGLCTRTIDKKIHVFCVLCIIVKTK